MNKPFFVFAVIDFAANTKKPENSPLPSHFVGNIDSVSGARHPRRYQREEVGHVRQLGNFAAADE
jgi:hypothetical protein